MNQPGPVKRSAEDILAIQAVVVLYGYVLDDREWDRFDQVFTQDAVVDFRDQSADPPTGLAPITGLAEIVRTFVRTADGWRIARKEIKRYNFDPPAAWGIEQAKIWHARGARFA